MTEPVASPLPLCYKCRREMPCVLVETVYGERNLCVGQCFRMWCGMVIDLKRRVGELLKEHHADFFDEPTRNDLKPVKP